MIMPSFRPGCQERSGLHSGQPGTTAQSEPGRDPSGREFTSVSLCPDCQQETAEANFCPCFGAVEPAPTGRFTGLVSQALVEPPPPSQWAGPDLSAVRFQPEAARQRRLVLKFGQMLGLTGLAGLVCAGFYLYQRANYREAVRHRVNGMALTRQGDFAAAHRQLAAAPEEAETFRARAELAVAEGEWQEAADQFRKISVDDADVNAHLDKAAQERAQALVKEARQSSDTARALSLSDQAESLLDQHHARPQQRAAVHFLRVGLFERLGLRSEAKAELQTALELDPGLVAARQLMSQWTPRPVPPRTEEVVRRPTPNHPPPVEVPRLQTQPDYPTYQPPDEDLEDEREGDERNPRRFGPNGKKRRR